jgi:hypothetical protein
MSLTKRAGSGAGSEAVSQRQGSAYLDPYKGLTDPEHCLQLLGRSTFQHCSRSVSCIGILIHRTKQKNFVIASQEGAFFQFLCKIG